MARKAIRHGTDNQGRKIALIDNSDSTFTLLVKCANYAAHVRGGIAYTWRWFGKTEKMSHDEANTTFDRRAS